MRLFIEPNDILMFRDGKPFAGGDDHFARGMFPPSPGTFYGAFRSHILSHRWSEYEKFKGEPEQIPEDVRKEIGTPEELGSIVIRQFTLAKRKENGIEQFFPMPMDIVKEKGGKGDRAYILNPIKCFEKRIITDLPMKLDNLWVYSENPTEGIWAFLSSYEMGKYLLGEIPSKWKRPEELFNIEDRTGIRKDRLKRSVVVGGLYSVEYFRLSDGIGFAVEIENTSLLPSSGILRLGGDNRSARYSSSSWDELPIDQIKKKIADDKRFKLVLKTPAFFNKGWIPKWINEDTMQGEIDSLTLRLVSACIGKPIGIGGYDFVKNIPKIMMKAVPAGSVYYFEFINGSVGSLFERLWLKSVSDIRSQEGFGITLIGGFDYV